jgi:tetrapyrrole methylase family protein/MazG family protein
LGFIAGRLRTPDGCPWDRKQSHASLRASVIEEAYEVATAIDEGDAEHLAEELGDLLLLVAMHAQIADEEGRFSIGDVFDHVNRKLVRRHPHVFGDVLAHTPEAVVQTWDAVKAAEREAKGQAADEAEVDPYDRLPASMPVMMRLAKLQRGSSTVDVIDPSSVADTLLALTEQLAQAGFDPEEELERAYRKRATTTKSG